MRCDLQRVVYVACVRDIPFDELRLYETELEVKLREDQQIVIQVISFGEPM